MNNVKRKRTELEGSPPVRRESNDIASKPRLTRACAECKKHKIKCLVESGQTACVKCLKSGIECVPHNFAQKFLDEDAAWKSEATTNIDQLKAAVQHLLRHNDLPRLSTYMSGERPRSSPSTYRQTESTLAPDDDHSISTVLGNFMSEGPSANVQEDDSDLVPLPMNNLYSLTEPGNSRLIRVDPADANGPDFITRGVVSVREAEYLYNYFRDHLNPLLWNGVLCSHQSLQSARDSSSLLVATVLTVAALHIPNQEPALRATYDAFVSLMRGSCLLQSQNLDGIRGLCIGAFYLTSLSWALCSRAVRVATEMNLHKSSLQFSRGNLEAYERVRLWYVLYVCDHQFALAYARPPMMHEDAAIRNADKLLTSGLSGNGDRRLVAQVKLFRILASSYFMYGCDPDLELADEDFEMLQSFNLSVDQWRLENQPKDMQAWKDGSNTSKESTLYYHLARFQLNSISLRGISARRASGLDVSWARQEAANNAITAATSTVRLIVEDEELRRALIGMPIFTHAMIAVCGSFLLKMAVAFGEPYDERGHSLLLPADLVKHRLNFHTRDALAVMQNLVDCLGAVTDNTSQRHVAIHVVTGFKELLQRFTQGQDGSTFVYSRPGRGEVVTKSNTNPGLRSLAMSGNSMESHVDRDQALIGPTADHNVAQTDMEDFELQQDPFDLMGDLDWRFDDNFLWAIDNDVSYI